MGSNARFFLLLVGALAMGHAPSAQDLAEHVARVRAAYGAEAWPLGAVRPGLPLAALAFEGYRAGPVSSQGALIGRDFFVATAPEGAPALFHLEAQVFDSSEGAREVLVQWLAGLSSPALAPRDSEFGVDLGDAGYVGASGAGPRAVSWVAFVQSNVAVRLLNVDPRVAPDLPLPELAKAIDRAIVAQAPLASGVAVAKPRIQRLEAATAALVAGDRVKLDVAIEDPAGGAFHPQWRLSGTAQGYVEERADGWYVFTTGPGTLRMTLGVVSSTGAYAERSLSLEVADD
jgi:hypothetical protein